MIKYLFVALSLLTLDQDTELRKQVARTFEDGSPRVVLYFSEDETSYVKEEVYFSNGQLDYYGHYKNQAEHGEWKYFWENGHIKFLEYYEFGLEHGEMFDYDFNGIPIKKYVYRQGVLISEEVL